MCLVSSCSSVYSLTPAAFLLPIAEAAYPCCVAIVTEYRDNCHGISGQLPRNIETTVTQHEQPVLQLLFCPSLTGRMPILQWLFAHFPLPPCPSLPSSPPIFRCQSSCPKAGSPPRSSLPSATSRGSPLPRNPVKTEVANNKKCCYWAFYFVMLMILLTFAS